MRIPLLLAVASALMIGGGSLQNEAIAQEPIKIGFAVALSGGMKPWDLSWQTAVLAIDDINAKGGLLGRQIEYFLVDTKTDIAEGAKAAAEVADKGADLAIITCDFDLGAPAALVTQNAGLISISQCAVDPKMGPQGVGPLVFTGAHAGQTHAAAMAEWAHGTKGFRSAYILTDLQIQGSEAMKSTTAGFKWAWNQLSGTSILGEDTLQGEDPTISSQITRIKNLPQPPDFIWMSDFAPAGASVLRQLRAAGIEIPVMAPMGMDGSYWWVGVPNLKELYIPVTASIYGNDPNPKIQEINNRLKEKFKETPVNAYHYYGYPIIELWAKAVERAGTVETDKVLEQMNKFQDEPTLVGPMSYSADLHIQNKGRFVVLSITTDANGNGKAEALGYVTSKPVPMDVLLQKVP